MTLWTKSQITLSVCIINLESAFDRPSYPQVGSNERGEPSASYNRRCFFKGSHGIYLELVNKSLERSQYVTSWIWKYWDLDGL